MHRVAPVWIYSQPSGLGSVTNHLADRKIWVWQVVPRGPRGYIPSLDTPAVAPVRRETLAAVSSSLNLALREMGVYGVKIIMKSGGWGQQNT